jgi:predicted metalloprotease with PDZ domain
LNTRLIIVLLALPIIFAGSSSAQDKEKHEKPMVESMPETGSGWLGVSTQDLTPKLSRKLNLKIEAGAFVKDVMDDSPAEKAGLQEEDVIVEFNGKQIDDADDLLQAVRKTKPGTSANVVVMRENERKTLQATIGSQPREHHSFSLVPPLPPRIHMRMFRGPEFGGLNLLELNDQLGTYFEAPHGRGVLVEEVEKNSTGEKAGFKAGDVIVKIGKISVENLSDISDAMENYKEGDKADVEVIRKGSRKTVTMEVDENGHEEWFKFRSRHWPHGSNFHEFDFDTETFRHNMDELKHELKSMGKEIRERMLELKEKIRKEIKEVTS